MKCSLVPDCVGLEPQARLPWLPGDTLNVIDHKRGWVGLTLQAFWSAMIAVSCTWMTAGVAVDDCRGCSTDELQTRHGGLDLTCAELSSLGGPGPRSRRMAAALTCERAELGSMGGQGLKRRMAAVVTCVRAVLGSISMGGPVPPAAQAHGSCLALRTC
jgi:hypothetical protein